MSNVESDGQIGVVLGVAASKDAYDFYKRYYGPNNAVLTIVGDFAAGDVRRLVEKHFSALARAPQSGAVRIVEPPP